MTMILVAKGKTKHLFVNDYWYYYYTTDYDFGEKKEKLNTWLNNNYKSLNDYDFGDR